MITIEELYSDNEFNDLLVYNAGKNYLEFDEFKQDVFFEIIDKKCKTMRDCKRAVWRVRERSKKKNILNYMYSFDEDRDSYNNEELNSVLWEDCHVL